VVEPKMKINDAVNQIRSSKTKKVEMGSPEIELKWGIIK
jgi:hypothetical protein